ARLDAHLGEDDGHQPGRDLLAGGHNRIIFARVVELAGLIDPADQLIGFTRHGRNHDGNLVTGLHLAFDMTRSLADALDIGYRSATEFDDDAGHFFPGIPPNPAVRSLV